MNATLHIARTPDPFARVPKELAKNKALSFKAKGIALFLCSFNDGEKVSAQEIINASSDGRDSVMSGIKELIMRGYILRFRTKNRKNGQVVGVKYIFKDHPEKTPTTGKSNSGNPSQVVGNVSTTGKSNSGRAEKNVPLPENPTVENPSQVVDNVSTTGKSNSGPPYTLSNNESNTNPPNPPARGELFSSHEVKSDNKKTARKSRTTLTEEKTTKYQGEHTELMRRTHGIFGHGPDYKWSNYLAKIWKQIDPSEAQVDLIVALYRYRSRQKDLDLSSLWKTTLSSLLINWFDMVERAHSVTSEYGMEPPPIRGEKKKAVKPWNEEPSWDWRSAVRELYPNCTSNLLWIALDEVTRKEVWNKKPAYHEN